MLESISNASNKIPLQCGPQVIKGVAASSGISFANTYVVQNNKFEIKKSTAASPEKEKERFQEALQKSRDEILKIQAHALKKIGPESVQIFDAHLLILEDPEIIQQTQDHLEQESSTAQFAFYTITQNYITLFRNMKNEYMKERASDIEDVSSRVLGHLLNQPKKDLSHLSEKVILVAQDITPSDMATLDIENVCGFITHLGGKTSHAAIMARTLEIPAITGVPNALEVIPDHIPLILNGDLGEVILNPNSEQIAIHTHLIELHQAEKKELLKFKDLPCITRDGKKISLASNIGTPTQCELLLKNGVKEVGLFRTEFLFMDRKSLPTEAEQYESYKKVLSTFAPEPVIIRTLDIGGDKELPYLKLPKETNPFLGLRAIRLCFDQKEIFKTQLRALLKASPFGKLKIMFPMISSLEEIREAKKYLHTIQQELLEKSPELSLHYEIGIMIEIPSAALISDLLAEEVDFFSIGTNDLIQYTCAVDRMNEKIHSLYNPYHPAVLKLIRMTVENAHKKGKWVGMCGEMAGQLDFIPYLIGLGMDELSISLSSFLKAKKLVLNMDFQECKKLTDQVHTLTESAEIESVLKDFIKSL